MGQEFRYSCTVETWRLLGFVGVIFVTIITLQHFELPSRLVVWSISSVRTDHIAETGSVSTDVALSNSQLVGNTTRLRDLNSTSADDTREKNVGYGVEKDADVNNGDDGFVSEASLVSNKSYVMDNNGESSHKGYIAEETEQRFSDKNISVSSENTVTPDVKIEPPGGKVVWPDLDSTTNTTNSSSKGSGPQQTEENVSLLPESTGNSTSSLPVLPLEDLSSNESVVEKSSTPVAINHGKSGELKEKTSTLHDNSPQTPVSYVKKVPGKRRSQVVSVSEMNDLLLQSWSSPSLMRPPRWASPVDQELLHAKSEIENAPIIKNDPLLYDPLYWNVSRFKRSYELMEELLKVFIYKEGERPILHDPGPVLKGIYASEGWFMKLLEANKKFVTKKPRNAHLFYLPFSSRNLETQLYVPDSHNHKNLIRYLKNYVDLIVAKHPFWNRTDGVDHFLVACHDWAPSETERIMSNCIRAMCNADVRHGFVFGKDVSLPETNVRTPQNPTRGLGGKPPSKRPILAFFAGSMHGYLRPILLNYWANKDPDMKIFGKMSKKTKGKMDYLQYMKNSKYCICPRGYEVNSPRIVEAVLYECVPVIISDNYVPPFFEVLNWESFAVFVLERDIPNLKNILLSIPERRFRQMQMRVKRVQQHFIWHARPVKYDLFHMILHSVWYNRVFQMQDTYS